MGPPDATQARRQRRARRGSSLLARPGQAAGRPAVPRDPHRPAHGHPSIARRPAGGDHTNPASAAPRSAERVQEQTGGSVGMAATKITPKEFVEALKDWSILDVVEAVKAIEDEFGIKAAAPVAVAAVAGPAGGAGGPAGRGETGVTVTLTAVGDSKIHVIKKGPELTQL